MSNVDDLLDDFDEMVNLADDAAKYNPKIMEEVMAAPDRAKAAYAMGKKISESQTRETDPVAYREKIRQEVLAEMEGKKTNPKTLHKVPGARTPRQVKKSGSSDGFGFGTLAGSGAPII